MRLLKWLIFLAHWGVARAEPGKFWHISDLHLDPDYKVSKDPLQVCPSAGSQPVPSAGPWGDYLCDSPWVLINSSIYAMKKIEPEPDFILWTGDDTPHVPDERLGEAAVLEIVERLTKLIREVFPDTKVYAALGNHDFHPKNQLPAGSNNIYNQVAELWRPWLSNESIALFKEGAFYSEPLPGPSRAGRIVVLNTNLYYSNNEQTARMADPGQQFQWLEDVLTNASRAGEMVYIIGHLPPGFFEKTRNKAWFRESFNEEYLRVVRQHHGVLAGQFFGHHHTDSFRMFYDDAGAPISVMFLTPGVTPWKTTLPGVINGANNPGIRVFEYDRATLSLQVRSPGSAGATGGGWEGPNPVTAFPNSQLIHPILTTEPQEEQATSTLLKFRFRTLEPPATKSGQFFPKSPFSLDHCHRFLPGLLASHPALVWPTCYMLQKGLTFLKHCFHFVSLLLKNLQWLPSAL
ncbi:PREDICTED: acid sphingomyelinase-like phosphodiesterase 3b [Galeopterus variegatus]|uniref:Acid sphingomyelinase-like phosphodiesterase 3b n=1 Tax=Galeopterus variegatus TaxID=482537 RepID=A0ABM0QZK0_GALVR|nr:PREDICTED: acid sphingomyelinase-like phosphodiesterase 3b [Galeopterus variegatus]